MTQTFRAHGLLEWMRGAVVGGLLYAHAAVTPSPAHRPRVTRAGHAFYAKSYQEYHRGCQTQFSSARGQGDWPEGSLEGPLAVAVDVACERPRTSKLASPRSDADNLAKGCLDAATKAGVWGDDTQIKAVFVQKRWARQGEKPGVALWIGRLADGGVDLFAPA